MLVWPVVVLLGDSITQYSFDGPGWGAYIAGLLQRKCDVINRGFSGYTTQYIVKVLDELVGDNLNAAAITIFLGANDASLLKVNPRQHVPLDKYEENLGLIVNHFLKLGIDSNKIILIAPPACDEKAWLKEMIRKGTGSECDRSNQVTGQYAEACHQVSRSKNCRFVNLWKEMMEIGNFSSHLNDGLHLSECGNQFLAKLLEPHINALTEKLPMILPLWRDFEL